MDGHTSHIGPEFIDKCYEFGITVEPRYKNIIGPAHRILIEEVFLYKGY
jgi:hypothetical protein